MSEHRDAHIDPIDPLDPIDAYIDGQMSPDERADFESRLETDPALRAQLELQSHIDARLRATMSPPPMPAAATTLPMPRRGLPAWLKVAAAIAMVAVGVWAAVAKPWLDWLPKAPSVLTADAVMKRFVDDGFKPIWTCENDKQFLQYSKDRLGVPFLVRPGQGVQVLGWSYIGGLLDQDSQILLVRAEDQPVLVVMGPRAQDRDIRLDAGSPLHLNRTVYRGVVMYEISTLDHPVVVNALASR